MVRTLGFHSKNVGSIPANPNILMIPQNNKQNTNKIKYRLTFVSLINPFLIKNINYDSYTKKLPFENKANRIYVKQSYMILTWFYYLSFLQKDNLSKNSFKNKINIFVSKTTRRKLTVTKAPIAHKNWSKEQYQFSFFTFKISTHFVLKRAFSSKSQSLNSADAALFFLILTKKNLLAPETNIFSMKNYRIFLQFKDCNFFSYYRSGI